MNEHPVVIIDADTFVQWVTDLKYGLRLDKARLRMGVEAVVAEMVQQRAWRRDGECGKGIT